MFKQFEFAGHNAYIYCQTHDYKNKKLAKNFMSYACMVS